MIRKLLAMLEYGDRNDPDVARSQEFIAEVNAMLHSQHGSISIDTLLHVMSRQSGFECIGMVWVPPNQQVFMSLVVRIGNGL